MSMGKVIGMGAALAAGLAVAGMAHASVSLTVNGTSISLSGGSGSYSSSGGTVLNGNGVFGWGTISIISNSPATTDTQAELNLSISGLYNTDPSAGTVIDIAASDSGFQFLSNTSANYLQLTGSVSANGQNSSDSASALSTASDNTNSITAIVGPFTESNGSVYSQSFTSTPESATGLTSPYSLATTVDFTITGSGTSNSGDLQGGNFDAAVTTNPISSNAVPLPGSGALAFVGGLALVGGMAIRRRMAH
jgi:hypothetical protein